MTRRDNLFSFNANRFNIVVAIGILTILLISFAKNSLLQQFSKFYFFFLIRSSFLWFQHDFFFHQISSAMLCELSHSELKFMHLLNFIVSMTQTIFRCYLWFDEHFKFNFLISWCIDHIPECYKCINSIIKFTLFQYRKSFMKQIGSNM